MGPVGSVQQWIALVLLIIVFAAGAHTPPLFTST